MDTKANYFTTVFDRNYLVKGILMINSLKSFLPEARFCVLALDEYTEIVLNRLSISEMTVFSETDIMSNELRAAKSNRGLVEYYWTLSSYFTNFAAKEVKAFKSITYLDADIYFFSNPERLLSLPDPDVMFSMYKVSIVSLP